MRFGIAWCSCLLAVACARENPEFGLGEDATEGAASGGTAGGSGTTAGMVDPTAQDDDDDDATDPDDDDDDNDPTNPDDDDDDDDDDPIDTGSEETDGPQNCPANLEVVVPVWEDTFVVTDLGGTCSGGSCELANFGASEAWPVFDDGPGGTYRAFMLARFDIGAKLLTEIDSVDLHVHVSNQQPQYMPFELVVFEVVNSDWGEGDGAEQLATKGEASWVDSAFPIPWTDDASSFEDALGVLLGEEPFGIVDGGTELVIALSPGEVADLIDTDGYLSVAVTTVGSQPTTLWTREQFPLATALEVIGCSE